MSIMDRVAADMKAAMTGGEKERLEALRLIRAELLKASKEGGGAPDPEREMAILKKMVKQRQESAEQFDKGDRKEMAAQERREGVIIESYLPAGLDEAAIAAAIDAVMAQNPEANLSQMGPITGKVMAKLKATGQPFDGKLANALVKKRLGG